MSPVPTDPLPLAVDPAASTIDAPAGDGAAATPASAPAAVPSAAPDAARTAATTVRRRDWQPPAYLMPSIELEFDLDPDRTVVHATAQFERNPALPHRDGEAVPLRLDGEDLELLGLHLDGRALEPAQYRVDATGLELPDPPARFELRTTVAIRPRDNAHLSGLYVSGGALLTQCEAQGFRRITYAQDRPDVMSRYRVRLRADATRFPVLLSNGNLLGGHADGTHHVADWQDPFPKPSYLFALVAGALECNESTLRTRSGRDVLLQIWCEPGLRARTEFAMQSLKRAVRWDEQRYGLELDLDRYMIVAAPDFNMGAMENKGLNIFNMKYLFADPRIATDDDFARIESIIGHEYFHNWTGNRVTCRDWFQLTLKEGLTVFRDQQFSADCLVDGLPAGAADGARGVHRIDTVRTLRATQFPEDAGPMAHPIRPDEYQAIDNFYTATVYEKGAEVIRMLERWVGEAGFRAGMDLYFERHDGQAVTCDDFVAAICDANGRDAGAFMAWYSTAGTPHVHVRAEHDPAAGRYSLHVRQHAGDGASGAPALLMPLTVGLIDRDDGRELVERTLVLDRHEQRFDFDGFTGAPPLASVLRGFTAPVILHMPQSDDELGFLVRHDRDAFNRWEAAQSLMTRIVLAHCAAGEPDAGHGAAAGSWARGEARGDSRGEARGEARGDAAAAGVAAGATQTLVAALNDVLADPALSDGLRQALLVLPTEGTLTERLDVVDPQRLRNGRLALRAALARALRAPLHDVLDRVEAHPQPWSLKADAVALRALHGTALQLLASANEPVALERARRLLRTADNMSDRQAALQALMLSTPALRDEALALFEHEFRAEPTVMDKWFAMQATMIRLDGDAPVLDRVRALLTHPSYSPTNPNKVRAVVHSFCAGNLAEFHRADGAGYRFWTEQVLHIDAANPQLAARLARALDRFTKFEPVRAAAMREALAVVAATAHSPDVLEIVRRSLAAAPHAH